MFSIYSLLIFIDLVIFNASSSNENYDKTHTDVYKKIRPKENSSDKIQINEQKNPSQMPSVLEVKKHSRGKRSIEEICKDLECVKNKKCKK